MGLTSVCSTNPTCPGLGLNLSKGLASAGFDVKLDDFSDASLMKLSRVSPKDQEETENGTYTFLSGTLQMRPKKEINQKVAHILMTTGITRHTDRRIEHQSMATPPRQVSFCHSVCLSSAENLKLHLIDRCEQESRTAQCMCTSNDRGPCMGSITLRPNTWDIRGCVCPELSQPSPAQGPAGRLH